MTRAFYISNAFEDVVKVARGITSDSPAASGKVFALSKSVRRAGGDTYIISLGRGRVNGSWKTYRARATRHCGVPIVYLDYWDIPALSHAVTAISLCVTLLRLAKPGSILVFYNCQVHYVLALIMARLLGMRCLLDLEDGYAECKYIMRNALNALLSKLYARLCSGAMLAAHVLKRETPLRRSYVCYGIAEVVKVDRDWSSTPLQILMGGSLLKETGAELFLETIYLMMHQHPLTLAKLRFVATGFGDCAEVLRKAASGDLRHCLSFRGRLTAGEYRDIMRESHVGLCLKLPQSSMGMTTFPSKVVELASYGLLVVSTRISDVPQIFDDCTAILLDAATPEALCKALIGASQKPEKAKATALAGQARVASLCSEEKVGAELWRFWRES